MNFRIEVTKPRRVCRLWIAYSDSTPKPQPVDRITGKPFATRSEVIAPRGLAATSQPLATQVGLGILQDGGSAVDAAIGANAALGLMEPTGCGIGGDLFAIVWDSRSGRLHGLNASGRSPFGLSLDRLKTALSALGTTAIPPLGFLPVSVPGAIDGWFALHGKFGRKSMAEILAPAIHYAEAGFPVSPLIAHSWGQYLPGLKSQPGAFAETFSIAGGAPAARDLFRNPDLAGTYRTLALEGRDAFYHGAIANRIDAFFRRNGGFLRLADLEGHRSEWINPVSVNYRGYDVHELPPNGQGIAVLQILNILEAYDLAGMGHDSARFLHLMIEAKKLVYGTVTK